MSEWKRYKTHMKHSKEEGVLCEWEASIEKLGIFTQGTDYEDAKHMVIDAILTMAFDSPPENAEELVKGIDKLDGYYVDIHEDVCKRLAEEAVGAEKVD